MSFNTQNCLKWFELRYSTYNDIRLLHFGGGSYWTNILMAYTIEYNLKAILDSIDIKDEITQKLLKREHDLLTLFYECRKYGYLTKFNTNTINLLKAINEQFARYPSGLEDLKLKQSLFYYFFHFDSLVIEFDIVFDSIDPQLSITRNALNDINYNSLTGEIFFHQNFHAMNMLRKIDSPDLRRNYPQASYLFDDEKKYLDLIFKETNKKRTQLHIPTARSLSQLVNDTHARRYESRKLIRLHD